MIYHTIYLLVATSLRQHETIYDQYLDAFREIVQHGEEATAAMAYPNGSQPHFTFEIGVGMPLLVTALNCRRSNVRHEALSLLKQCPAIQGFYMVNQGSALVAKAIEIEEALCCDPVNRDHDKETRRLQYVSVCRQDPAAYSLLIARKKPAASTEISGLTLVKERVPLRMG